MRRQSARFILAFVTLLILVSIGLYYATTMFFFQETNNVTMPPTSRCIKLGSAHYVDISDNSVMPTHTTGRLCDTLTITNHDNVLRLMAFGPHAHHVPYDGVTEKVLAQNDSLTITLNQAGTFSFHDHLNDNVVGIFKATK